MKLKQTLTKYKILGWYCGRMGTDMGRHKESNFSLKISLKVVKYSLKIYEHTSLQTLKAKRAWNDVFQVLKR